ncbi:MAG: response regulator transcription factor [Actinomycetota bacterium]
MAKVLIVDDEPSILQMLQMNLQIEGHVTYLASDGETALKRIQAEEPDLVLLDIMMPVLDGWGVLQQLAELNLKKRPRIIVMTAKAGGHDLMRGFRLGADEYITKPFEIDGFVEMVGITLARSEEEVLKRRQEFMDES